MSRIATPPRLASLSGDGGGEEGGGPLTWLDGFLPGDLKCQVSVEQSREFIFESLCRREFLASAPLTNVF